MRWRVVVAVVLALVLGAVGGWFYADSQGQTDTEPRPVAASVAPVPATPSLPVEVAQPDPDDPTLATGIELTPTTLDSPTEGDPLYEVELPVPTGWEERFLGDDTWVFTVPGNDSKSYGLRVQIIAAEALTVPTAVSVRISKLKSAQAQSNIADLEYDVTPTNDGFTATYTDQDDYSRLSVEQFYSGPDGNAFATIAAYGRFRDRLGLEDLVARISIDLRTRQF